MMPPTPVRGGPVEALNDLGALFCAQTGTAIALLGAAFQIAPGEVHSVLDIWATIDDDDRDRLAAAVTHNLGRLTAGMN